MGRLEGPPGPVSGGGAAAGAGPAASDHPVPSAPSAARAGEPALRAALVDVDGVVPGTADLDARAWKQTMDATLPLLGTGVVAPLDPGEEYQRLVAGRSREDAVRAVLGARGLQLPDGEPDDDADQATVHGLAHRVRAAFAALVAERGLPAFPSTVGWLRRLRERGLAVGLVTGSRESVDVLAGSGAGDLFDATVGGASAERRGLHAPPRPDMVLEAARELGFPPSACLAVVGASSAVQAARLAGVGLVVGVDRTGNRSQLLAAGADLVVGDLGATDLDALLRGGAGPVRPWRGGASASAGPWVLTYSGFDPEQEGVREALCTLANGYLGTRGAAPECDAGPVHYPGTYLAGVYNRLRTPLDGRSVEHEHLVNAPNWLPLQFAVADGGWVTPDAVELLEYRQELDLRRALLTRVLRCRDGAGRTTRVTSERLVSQHARHLVALRTTFAAEDWSGPLRVRSSLDGTVVNGGVADDAGLAHRHLRTVAVDAPDPDTVRLVSSTTTSHVRVAMAARTRVYSEAEPLSVERHLLDAEPGRVGHELELVLAPGVPLTVEKVVAVATSRDRAISDPGAAVATWAARAGTYAELAADHVEAWAELWRRFTLSVEAGERARTALTLHTFHVLQTAAGDQEVDAGLPARGLHGEGYRGHVFWDEMLVHPMLTLRQPELTRAVLLYRHRRLAEARAAARTAGLAGALFPWQSGSDGREETPQQLFNPRTGRWMPDHSHLQRHVGLAVAYSVLQFVEASDDLGFLEQVGAELVVEVLRCFASMARYDPGSDRYDIEGVMGPDEFHDGYPGRSGSGVRNNAYTNVLLAWTLRRAADLLHRLDEVDGGRARRRLDLGADELERWERLSRRLRVHLHADGVLSQFDGYEGLAELDWDHYRARYGDLGRLDLILAAEGDTPNRYRVAKQPDVLMLLYLLSAEELRETLERMGYRLDGAAVRRTVEFYLARTSHGSTLSRPVCSWLLARGDRLRSWSLFNEALDSDLADIQGGTTREGIHLGAMAGTVDLLLRCYTGLETRDGALWLHPALPPELGRVRFEVSYRGHAIEVDLRLTRLVLRLQTRAVAPVQAQVAGQHSVLHAGHTYHFDLARHPAAHKTPVERG